jgi:hypothetical protein
VKTLKALLLMPAAFAGAFTVFAFSIPRWTFTDVMVFAAVLAPVYLGVAVVLGLMWGASPGRRYLGHARGTWSILVAVAYALGAVCALLF